MMINVLVVVAFRLSFRTRTENSYVPGSRLFAGKTTEAFGAMTSGPPPCGPVLLELHTAPLVALTQLQS